jgi:hypothetical protein
LFLFSTKEHFHKNHLLILHHSSTVQSNHKLGLGLGLAF